MEFKEAMRIWKRMCEKHGWCTHCPMFKKVDSCPIGIWNGETDHEAILAKWAAEHPEKTIADDFFEKHPKALRGTGCMKDTPLACAYQCGYGRSRDDICGTSYCAECWRRPLEEVEG